MPRCTSALARAPIDRRRSSRNPPGKVDLFEHLKLVEPNWMGQFEWIKSNGSNCMVKWNRILNGKLEKVPSKSNALVELFRLKFRVVS